MYRLFSGTWYLHEKTESKSLLSVYFAYAGYWFNTGVCINNSLGQEI